MTPVSEPAANVEYDLFISYRSERSGAHAVALRDALYALDKRHQGERPIRIFLDRISLRAGGLDENIAHGLRTSRSLVVLIDETTVHSPWVSREVREWLEAGGKPDRLFLMRTSGAVDLSWDTGAGQFANPDSLPEALRDLFASEQKYIDFTVRPRRVNEVPLIGLYASVMAADPEAMGEDERRHLQKQRRRNRVFTAVLAGLLVVSLVAGGIAVSNFLRADASARQARADALGAEGLLTLPVAPDRAIDQAVEASRLGTGTSVRSVLLAVASDTRRLQGTVSLSRDGGATSLSGLSLSPESRTLTAWGPTGAGESVVVTWETTNRDVMQRFVVAEETIDSLVEVPGIAYIACTPRRALTIDWRTHEVGVLHPAHAGCATEGYLGGGVADVVGDDGSHRLLGVTIDGQAIDHGGSLVPGSREAVWRLIEDDGNVTAMLTPKGVTELAAQARGSLASADSDTFITKGKRGYRMFTVSGGTLRQAAPAVPADAVAVAGWEDYRDRPRVLWVTATGRVGWNGGRDTLAVREASESSGTTDDSAALAPVLVRYQSEDALLIIGDHVIRLTVRDDRLVQEPLGKRSARASEASRHVATTCGGAFSVILDEAAYVTADAVARETPVQGRLTEAPAALRNCHAVEAGPPVRVDGEVVVDSAFANLRLTDVGAQGELALARGDGSVSYFSGADDAMVPWTITPNLPTLMAPDGTAVLEGGPPPVVVSEAGTVEMGLGAEGSWTLPSPDGKGGVLVDDKRRWLAIGGEIPLMLSPNCTDESFEPAPGFGTDLDAARTPQLIGHTANGRIDCLTGTALPAAPAVLAYVIGRDLSFIVSREGGTVHLTLWRAGDTSPTVRELPGDHPSATSAAVSGDRVILGGSDSPELLEFRWNGTELIPGQRYALAVGAPSTFAYSPDEALLMAVTSRGLFDILDTATGRLLASHTAPLGADGYQGLVITERDGLLLAFLGDGTGWGGTLIRVPVGIPQLQDLLCRVHHSTQC